MTEMLMKDIPDLFVLGRTSLFNDDVFVYWVGSGIECNINASEMWISLESVCDAFDNWITIEIDGVLVSRMMLPQGTYNLCVFRKLEKKQRNVRILKDNQPPEFEKSCLKFHSVKTDGVFSKVSHDVKIEFIGDSITTGEGLVGNQSEMDWKSIWMSFDKNYAKLVSSRLNADFRLISQCGWGVYCGWDNNPYHAIPLIYDKICDVAKCEKEGGSDLYDFNSWSPDIVIINLGTNDSNAFNQPTWKDDKTCRTFKMRLNDDGSCSKEDMNAFRNAVLGFLLKVREKNPSAIIIWCLGLFELSVLDCVKSTVEEFSVRNNDKKISFIELDRMQQNEIGARAHPGVLAHEKMAAKILEEINKMKV